MPFDGPNKAKDRGYQLVYALRHIGKFKDFEWDFTCVRRKKECWTAGCALGLASELWGLDSSQFHAMNCGITNTANMFGISPIEARDLFFGTGLYGKKAMQEVTPEMVADELEKALNNAV